MPSYLSKLRVEIDADPLARGYSGMTDTQITASLNTKDRVIDRTAVPVPEIFAAIEPTDYLAVTNVDRQRYLSDLFQLDSIPLDSGNVRSALSTIFSGTSTLTNLQALQTETISRGAELGLGAVSEGDVTKARSM
jgi:hypothetical protein